jgi:hypothetical protein
MMEGVNLIKIGVMLNKTHSKPGTGGSQLNHNYLGGRHQEDGSLKPTQGK